MVNKVLSGKTIFITLSSVEPVFVVVWKSQHLPSPSNPLLKSFRHKSGPVSSETTQLSRNSYLHLKRFQVEELRRRLAALEAMKLGLDDNFRDLDHALERENQRSGDSAIARLAMPNVRQMIELRRKNIEKTRADLERDRAGLEAELEKAVEEMKAAEFSEVERGRRASEAAETLAEYRREQHLIRQHLRRHAIR